VAPYGDISSSCVSLTAWALGWSAQRRGLGESAKYGRWPGSKRGCTWSKNFLKLAQLGGRWGDRDAAKSPVPQVPPEQRSGVPVALHCSWFPLEEF
jgi:hypothetical protein